MGLGVNTASTPILFVRKATITEGFKMENGRTTTPTELKKQKSTTPKATTSGSTFRTIPMGSNDFKLGMKMTR